jgi:hypothetical protein
MRKLLLLFCLISTVGGAQTTLNTNPPSLRWYRLKTPHFKILYPKGFEVQAQRMANTLETIYEPEAVTMGVRPRPIPLILQNQSSISNGFVTLGPRRSEFFAMPSQDYNFVGTNDWLDLLAVHEYRHIAQFQRSITGINKLAYYVFGQQTLAALSFVSAPQWFWEGDAVAIETAFTSSGRGRIPHFDMIFRSNLLEGRSFNYHKQYLRSYKHNIPNHYVLGYQMVNYLRDKTHDPMIWEKIARRAWSGSIIPFTFSSAIKKETGLYVTDLYREMAADRQQKWKAQTDTLVLTPVETLTPRKGKAFTDYQFPQVLDDGQILALKNGIGDIDQLVVVGKSGRTFVPGIINNSGMLSAAQGRIVWNEHRFDPRWPMRTYSVVMGYDIRAKVKHQVSKKSRYAGAALSPDGNTILTIETGTDYQIRMVLLDYQTGAVISTFENPENSYYSMPVWENAGSVLVIKTLPKGKTITQLNVKTGEQKDLLPVTKDNLGAPRAHGRYIFYNSPRSGIDNIYAWDAQTGIQYQVTVSKYGAYNAVVSSDGKKLIYSDHTRDGQDIVQTDLDPSRWKVVSSQPHQPSTFFQHLVEQEGHPDILSTVPTTQYEAKPYSRIRGMINPHSWGAFFNNSSLTQAEVGISSKDVLSTTELYAGYVYDVNERTGSWKGRVSYQGLYPIIDLEVLSGNREEETGILGRDVTLRWKEVTASGGVRLPFVLTKSKYISQLEISNQIQLTDVNSFSNKVSENGTVVAEGNSRFVLANDTLAYGFINQPSNGKLLANRLIVSWTNFLKTSPRDFNPAWGQFLTFESFTTPYGGDFQGRLTAIRAGLYFPGLAKHHSLVFRLSSQSMLESVTTDTYNFRNRVFRPRGYAYPRDSKFTSFSSSYALPLWYPDIALGPILNIQRIKANAFLDWGQGSGRNYFYNINNNQVYFSSADANYLSMGLELTADINLFRFLPQFEVGVRTTYLSANRFNNSGVVTEVIIGNIPF